MHETVGQNAARVQRVESRESRVNSRRLLSAVGRRLLAVGYSPAPSPQPRGITLTEVLISLGILTIGLLGVASLFPVGSYYMQKGDIADRGSQIAQAAFNDALARGWLNPAAWLTWEDGNIGLGTARLGTRAKGNTFTRPLSESLSLTSAAIAAGSLPDPTKQYKSMEYGSIFVIDPAGIASVALPMTYTASNQMKFGGSFPASLTPVPTSPSYAPEWSSWSDNANVGLRWPVRRVTFRQPANPALQFSQPMQESIADRYFSSRDDLAFDLPTASDKPAIQISQISASDLSGTGVNALSRQSRGDYSWIVTVSPTTSEARDALATDSSAYTYEVSVVVFHKRVLPRSPETVDDMLENVKQLQNTERSVQAKILSSGLSGGEVLLTRFPATESLTVREPVSSPFDSLKTGQWIMLCGPHPNSTNDRALMVSHWYRVLNIEGKGSRLDANGRIDSNLPTNTPERRLVSLRGPQWPWQPLASPPPAGASRLAENLYVCIPSGAVAVHAKTIHLEGNSVWGGGALGLGAPSPPPGPRYTN